MEKNRIQIGSGPNGNPVFLPEISGGHMMLTGGSDVQRQQVMRSLAESVSRAGVPVFLTDTKGKLSSLSETVPCTLWDLQGKSGLPLRTTVTELGPTLLSFLLKLNDKQSELLRVVFKIADESGLLLIDTKDLKALLNEITLNHQEYTREYGTLSKQSLSAILQSIVSLETRGAQDYLYEPAIDTQDFLLETDPASGRVHLLDARQQMEEPGLYACFLLYLLGEWYENLPGAPSEALPRLVMFVDAADLFFGALPDSLGAKAQQILDSLREQGIFVCLSAGDAAALPQAEALSAGTLLNVTGEGIVSLTRLSEAAGLPEEVVLIPSKSASRTLSLQERNALCEADPLHEKYKIPFERDSAYEFLKRRGLSEESGGPDDAQPAQDTNAGPDGTSAGGETDEAADGTASGPQTAALSVQEDASSGTSAESDADAAEEETDSSLQEMAKRAKSSAKSLGNTVAGTVGRKVGKTIGSTFGDFGETLGGNIGASLGRGIINTLFKS